MITVQLRQTEGMQFVATADSGHQVILDTSREKGGQDSGPRPMELLLIALAGCTAMDVVAILKKFRQKYDRFEIQVSGERRETHPRVYTRIELLYRFEASGELREDRVRRAIELSRHQFCSASAMLEKVAEITARYEIHTPTGVVEGVVD